jgi:hypothetical protein
MVWLSGDIHPYVAAARDRGRVMAILYCPLATSLRSLAIIIPIHPHLWSLASRFATVSYNYHMYAYNAECWRRCPYPIIIIYTAFRLKNGCDNMATMPCKWASMEGQCLFALYQGKCMGCAGTWSHNRTIVRLFKQKPLRQDRYHGLQMSVKGASTIVGLV